MVHPIPDDMRVKIGLPGWRIIRVGIVSFIFVDMYLDGSDSPFLTHFSNVFSYDFLHFYKVENCLILHFSNILGIL